MEKQITLHKDKKSKFFKKFMVPLLISGIISSCGTFDRDSKNIISTTEYNKTLSTISRHEYDLNQMEYIKEKDRGSPFDFYTPKYNLFSLGYKYDLEYLLESIYKKYKKNKK
jgi:hypothetical protein